jgi:flavodoxin
MASRILVVCYSRGGTTLRVATELANFLDADFDRIGENDPRSGVAGYMRSALEAVAKGLPTIHTRKDPRDYDVVVLGTPVWVGTMASPMRSYLHLHAGDLKHAAFFCVMGGRGGDAVVREMQLACDAREAPTCVILQREAELGRLPEAYTDFVRSLQNGIRPRAQQSTAAA